MYSIPLTEIFSHSNGYGPSSRKHGEYKVGLPASDSERNKSKLLRQLQPILWVDIGGGGVGGGYLTVQVDVKLIYLQMHLKFVGFFLSRYNNKPSQLEVNMIIII